MKTGIPARLTKSLEDYLEAVLFLSREKKTVRVTDIAERLRVKKPSVTHALNHLSENGFLKSGPYRSVTLTPRGTTAAETLAASHRILKTFLTHILGVPEKKAEENACRIEHAVDREIIEKLAAFVDRKRS